MVDVGRAAEPQLGAVLPAGVHDREVVPAGLEDEVLLLLGELGDAADEEADLVALGPVLGGRDLGAHAALQGVARAVLDLEAGLLVEDAEVAEDLEGKKSLFLKGVKLH